jgi:hypothetical protein
MDDRLEKHAILELAKALTGRSDPKIVWTASDLSDDTTEPVIIVPVPRSWIGVGP